MNVSVAPGASQRVTITYTTPAAGSNLDMRLRVWSWGPSWQMALDSATMRLTVNETAVPVVSITPRQDTVLFTKAFTATIAVCDADGVVRVTSAKFNGRTLPPRFANASVSGCYTAQQATFGLLASPGENTFDVTVTDGVHTTTKHSTFTYDPAVDVHPLVTADLASVVAAPYQVRTDTFRITNPGRDPMNYQMWAQCDAYNIACEKSHTNISLAAGATERVTLTYTVPASGNKLAMRLRVWSWGPSWELAFDSATTYLTVGSGAAPQVGLSLVNGTTTPVQTLSLTAQWCDPDDALSVHQLTVNGQLVADPYVAQTRAGCASAGTSVWNGLTLVPGPNRIVALVRDAAGHATTATSTVTYKPTPADFAPQVSPKNTTASGKRQSGASVLMTVTNTGRFSANYTYTASCGTVGFSGYLTDTREPIYAAYRSHGRVPDEITLNGWDARIASGLSFDAFLAELNAAYGPATTTLREAIRAEYAAYGVRATDAWLDEWVSYFTWSGLTWAHLDGALDGAVGAPFSQCALAKTQATLTAGAQDTVRVYYTTPAGHAIQSMMTFIASASPGFGQVVADTATVTLATRTIAQSYQPALAPATGAYSAFPGISTGLPFVDITNAGADTATYTMVLASPDPLVLQPTQAVTTLAPLAPGMTRRVWTQAGGANAGSTTSLSVKVLATDGRDTTAAMGNYTMSGLTTTYGFALSGPPATIPTVRESPLHVLPYYLTATGQNRGDVIHVSVACTGIVINCRGATSNAVTQDHAIYWGSLNSAMHYDVSADPSLTSGTIKIVAYSLGDPTKGDSSISVVTVPGNSYRAIAVSPENYTLPTSPGQTPIPTFTISNQGSDPAVFNYSWTCAAVLACSPSAGSGTTPSLPAQGTFPVHVTVPTPAIGSSGTVTLTASHSTAPAMTATGTITVVSPNTAAITVTTATINPGAAIDRSACLAVSVGPSAASECGDLRLSHVLPAVTTYGKTRAPVLTYVSRHAAPVVLLAANVTIAPTTTPSSLVATVTVTPLGHPTLDPARVTRTVPWNAAWSDGLPRRIVVPVSADEAHLPTGAFQYTLEVKPSEPTMSYMAAHDTGTFTIIDRRRSPFGAGWWIDGLEQIFSVDDTRKLWIGGDGNARVYTYFSAEPGKRYYRVEPVLDRPDTLVQYTADNRMDRMLAGGGSVRFNAAGQHTSTVNRLGHTTRFNYSGDLIQYISVPVASGAPLMYSLGYDVTAALPRLQSVTAPYVNGTTRGVMISQTNGWVTQIKDPDATVITLGYHAPPSTTDGWNRVAWRANRLRDTTFFTYNEAGLLRTGEIDLRRTNGDGAPRIIHRFCPAESRSLATCVNPGDLQPQPLAKVYSLYDGPRNNVTDAADSTLFFHGRYGTVDTVVNALGHRTRIERDAIFPLLAAATIAPNGHRTEAFYNTQGLAFRVIDRNPLGDGQNDTTHYTWHAQWNEPLTVVGPSGERVEYTYDTSAPNRRSQRTGLGAFTTFDYDASNRVEWITPAGNAPAHRVHLEYDTRLGNVARETAAGGAVTNYYPDDIGRVGLVESPIDATHWRYQTFQFDLRDRVRVQRDSTPQLNTGVPAATRPAEALVLELANTWDDEGQLTLAQRTSFPDHTIGYPVQRWTYDAAHRIASIQQPNGIESLAYDLAGNVRTRQGRRQPAVTTATYDAVNRVLTRTTSTVSYNMETAFTSESSSAAFPHFTGGFTYDVHAPQTLPPGLVLPGDVASFTYDITGGIQTAFNRDARVSRTYYPNGALQTETQQLAAVATDVADPFAQHTYRLEYAYDKSGRRRQRTDYLPSCTPCVQQYQYASLTGLLEGTTDQGASFGFGYDLAGRVETRTASANGVTTTETLGYDADGLMGGRTVVSNGATIYGDVLAHDRAGRVTVATTLSSDNALVETTYQGYTGLGALAAMQRVATGQQLLDEYRTDAFGNQLAHYRTLPGSGRDTVISSYNGERLVSETPHAGGGSTAPVTDTKDVFTYGHDESGNTLRRTRSVYQAGAGNFVQVRTGWEQLWQGYDAEDRLRVVQRSYWTSGTTLRTSFTEYRYDALGRRVLTRTRFDQYCPPNGATGACLPSVERTVWDGDQLLAEYRVASAQGVPDPYHYCADGEDASPKPGFPNVAACRDSAMGPPPATRWEQTDMDAPEGGGFWGGRVRYTHGGGIDQPLAVWRSGLGVGLVPHRSWRGLYKSGTYLGAVPSVPVLWPARNQDAFGHSDSRAPNPVPQNYWMGTIIDGGSNATGLVYQRNRYYDPQSGRFTQEDPIGLAGGMNLYGFASGDPVNFSDPFGLCKHGTNEPACKTRDAAAKEAMRSVNAKSVRQNLEYGGALHRVQGGYEYDQGVPLGASGGSIRMGKNYEGYYHTHGASDPNLITRNGDGNEVFSSCTANPANGCDKHSVDLTGKPGYLITPSGKMLRYDPDPTGQQNGKVTTLKP